MKVNISLSAKSFTTKDVANYVAKLPKSYGVTDVKTTTNTVKFKQGTVGIILKVDTEEIICQSTLRKLSSSVGSYAELKNYLNDFTPEKIQSIQSEEKLMQESSKEFIPIAKAVGFKSPKLNGKYLMLGDKQDLIWSISKADKGFELYGEPLDEDSKEVFLEFSDAKGLESLLKKQFTGKGKAFDYERLDSGIYFCKEGTYATSLKPNSVKALQKNNKKLWKVAPYQSDVYYVFSEKPTKLGSLYETSQLGINDCGVKVSGKGIVIIALDDD